MHYAFGMQVFSVSMLQDFDLSGEVVQCVGFAGKRVPTGTGNRQMVGREAVLQMVRKMAQGLVQDKEGSLLLVHAAAGFGKSKLLHHLQNHEEYAGWKSSLALFSAAGARELRPVPLTPWRSIIEACALTPARHQ